MAQSYVFAGVGGYYGTKDKSGKAGVFRREPPRPIGTMCSRTSRPSRCSCTRAIRTWCLPAPPTASIARPITA